MANWEERLLENIRKEQQERRKVEALGLRKKDPNLKAISDSLDAYYLLTKLKVYCAFLSYRHLSNPNHLAYEKKDLYLIEPILQLATSNVFKHTIIVIFNNIRLLYEHIKDHSEIQDQRYLLLFDAIKKEVPKLSLEESLEMYSFLTNYCIYRMNKGASAYQKQYLLVNNAIINLQYGAGGKKRTKLQAGLFRNTVVVALKLKKEVFFSTMQTEGLRPKNEEQGFSDAFEWTEQFIDYYSNKLTTREKRPYYIYCMALLEFNRQKFGKAHRLLSEKLPRIHGIFFNLDIKILYLKVLFELLLHKPLLLENDEVDFAKVLESYRGLIRDEQNRKRQLGYQQAHYAEFGKLLKQLYLFHQTYKGVYKGNNKGFRRSKEQLRRNIMETSFTYTSWMLEKLEAIK